MSSEVVRNIHLQIAAGKVPRENVDHLPEITEELLQALSYLRGIERFGIALSKGDLTQQVAFMVSPDPISCTEAVPFAPGKPRPGSLQILKFPNGN